MSSQESTMTILVYSDDRSTREQVRLAIGRRPAADLPRVEFVEVATHAAVIKILDAGGMGVARQLKEEVYQAPPVLVLIGRPQDAWLATWSRAEAVVSHPLDPMVVANAVAGLMRQRLAEVPAAS